MSLEKWSEYGWLRPEPTSPEEIRGLWQIVVRDLNDAGIQAISTDRRFEAAYSAARTLANIALRTSGYRTSSQMGHHQKTIESLELTLRADDRLIQKLKVFSRKRHATSYDTADNITAHELEQMLRTAEELKQKVLDWLRNTHPALSEAVK